MTAVPRGVPATDAVVTFVHRVATAAARARHVGSVRHNDRQTETYRQTDRETDIQTGIQIDTQTHRHTDTQTCALYGAFVRFAKIEIQRLHHAAFTEGSMM